jgi:hypothetical protein
MDTGWKSGIMWMEMRREGWINGFGHRYRQRTSESPNRLNGAHDQQLVVREDSLICRRRDDAVAVTLYADDPNT